MWFTACVSGIQVIGDQGMVLIACSDPRSKGKQEDMALPPATAAAAVARGRSRLSSLHSNYESVDSSNSGGSTSGAGSNCNGELPAAKSNYRILILGACGVGKTSIVRQFLYDKFSPKYKATACEDMYRGEFEIHGQKVGFDIQASTKISFDIIITN